MKMFNKYKFSNKTQTLGGTISVIMGIGAICSFVYGISIAFKEKGNAGLEVGSFGLLCLMLSFIGMVIGLLSFKEDDKFYGLSKFGSLMCGIFTIFMISVVLMGLY